MHRPNAVESSPYGPNLLLNPDFETAGSGQLFDSWAENSGTSTVTDETSDVHSGAHAARISADSGTPYYRQFVTVTAQTQYYLAFWCHKDTGDTGTPRYRVADHTHSNFIIGTTQTGIHATTYTYFSTTFTTPAACTQIRVELLGSSNAADDAFFDDVELRLVL